MTGLGFGHTQLKGYRPRTIKSYVNMVACYAHHVGKSPELTGCEDARAFMVPSGGAGLLHVPS